MAVAVGVCAPWVDAGDVQCFADLGLDADQADQVVTWASEILYVLSNKHWPGVCDRTVRPDLGAGRVWWCERPGRWSSLTGRWSPGDGGEMRIPGPVQSVTGVVVDGVTLAPSAYTLQGANRLFRVDGFLWPTGQDLTRDPTAVPVGPLPAGALPAWQVEYEWGAAPPPGGRLAAQSLACEIALAATGKPCRLPWSSAAATMNRRGVTVNFDSVASEFKQGLVGLADVNQWIITARGGAWRSRKARVGRADAPPRRVVSTWPAAQSPFAGGAPSTSTVGTPTAAS